MLEVPYVTGYLSEHFGDDAFRTLAGYQEKGGYEAARSALREMTPDDVVELMMRGEPAAVVVEAPSRGEGGQREERGEDEQ